LPTPYSVFQPDQEYPPPVRLRFPVRGGAASTTTALGVNHLRRLVLPAETASWPVRLPPVRGRRLLAPPRWESTTFADSLFPLVRPDLSCPGNPVSRSLRGSRSTGRASVPEPARKPILASWEPSERSRGCSTAFLGSAHLLAAHLRRGSCQCGTEVLLGACRSTPP